MVIGSGVDVKEVSRHCETEDGSEGVTDKLSGFGFNNELLLLQILNESQ
jgi:hypothetical protein